MVVEGEKYMKYLNNKVVGFSWLLSVLFAFIASAKNIQEVSGGVQCSAEELAAEPIMQKPFLSSPAWENYFKDPKVKELFDPNSFQAFYKRINLSRLDISMSPLANVLSQGIQDIRNRETQIVTEGQIEKIKYGQTYSNDELEKLKENEKKVRDKLAPLLSSLYNAYYNAVKNEETKNLTLSAEDAQVYSKILNEQRDHLMALIQKERPSLLEKLGPIKAIKDLRDSPLSYRDGYIVKITFDKFVPNSRKNNSISVYPHFIQNQLDGTDLYFLAALESWEGYTYTQWKEASDLKIANQMGFTWGLYDKLAYMFSSKGSSQIINDEPIRQKMYLKASSALFHARRVHEFAKNLSKEDLLALMDLFKALRFGDYPHCQSVVSAMNSRVASLLGGTAKSSRGARSAKITKSSKELKPAEKYQADALARDVVYYQDIYHAFSYAAAVASEVKQSTPPQK